MADLVPTLPADTRRIPHESRLAIGQWYWLLRDNGSRTLCCITRVGSNYARLSTPDSTYWDVHFDDFDDECVPATTAKEYIAGQVADYQTQARELMREIHAVTARLGVTPRAALTTGDETQALVASTGGKAADAYKQELVLARKETLPALFKQLEETHKRLATWMKADMLPMRAEVEKMKRSIAGIDDRIFSVEIYAGLVEQVKQVREGAPAGPDMKIHLMQRRHYMDEECLVSYEAGGMNFANINDFDKWLARDENFNRVLPHPRCVVAFRVRRNDKEYEATSLLQFIQIQQWHEWDKSTFLYIRNGAQLWRLETEIDFGARLFPDTDRDILSTGKKVWAKTFAGTVDDIISDDHYQAIVRKDREKERALKKAPKKDQWRMDRGDEHRRYVLYNQDTVLYDDITAVVHRDMRDHNRIVLLLQGLLDRSMTFHPHPPWQLWTPEGFAAALTLVYDDSRVLAPENKPDFEAYRARLNAQLQVGSMTIGQHDAWWHANSRARAYGMRDKNQGVAYNNDGPAEIAPVVKLGKRTRKVTYAWERERLVRTDAWFNRLSDTIKHTFTTDIANVFNISAYKPGDFKQFYADPRTRAEYLQWAPFLLAAEDWHAGKKR